MGKVIFDPGIDSVTGILIGTDQAAFTAQKDQPGGCKTLKNGIGGYADSSTTASRVNGSPYLKCSTDGHWQSDRAKPFTP